MKITKRAGPPEDLVYFDDELDLKEKDVEDVVVTFLEKYPFTQKKGKKGLKRPKKAQK